MYQEPVSGRAVPIAVQLEHDISEVEPEITRFSPLFRPLSTRASPERDDGPAEVDVVLDHGAGVVHGERRASASERRTSALERIAAERDARRPRRRTCPRVPGRLHGAGRGRGIGRSFVERAARSGTSCTGRRRACGSTPVLRSCTRARGRGRSSRTRGGARRRRQRPTGGMSVGQSSPGRRRTGSATMISRAWRFESGQP